jgi:EpsI family protein
VKLNFLYFGSSGIYKTMQSNRINLILASAAILGAAIMANVLAPRVLMARNSVAPGLDTIIPRQFGTWKVTPEISPVRPVDNDAYVQPDPLSGKIYSQEVGRGYSDGQGHIVMLMVAYGPVQNYRLKAHRPEICYTANGFRISDKFEATLSYRAGSPPIKMMRIVTQREARFEPVSYWMRIGNDVTNGVIGQQLTRLKYGLRGLIPDGALIRVSTIGLPEKASFELQDRFIRDLLAVVPPQDLKFFVGAS